jgi:hypothetical protein
MKNRRKRGQLRCRTYWGSHGCAKRRDHPGDHECDCSKTEIVGRGASERGVTIFGEDAE